MFSLLLKDLISDFILDGVNFTDGSWFSSGLFAVKYNIFLGRAVTNVVRTCGLTCIVFHVSHFHMMQKRLPFKNRYGCIVQE